MLLSESVADCIKTGSNEHRFRDVGVDTIRRALSANNRVPLGAKKASANYWSKYGRVGCVLSSQLLGANDGSDTLAMTSVTIILGAEIKSLSNDTELGSGKPLTPIEQVVLILLRSSGLVLGPRHCEDCSDVFRTSLASPASVTRPPDTPLTQSSNRHKGSSVRSRPITRSNKTVQKRTGKGVGGGQSPGRVAMGLLSQNSCRVGLRLDGGADMNLPGPDGNLARMLRVSVNEFAVRGYGYAVVIEFLKPPTPLRIVARRRSAQS